MELWQEMQSEAHILDHQGMRLKIMGDIETQSPLEELPRYRRKELRHYVELLADLPSPRQWKAVVSCNQREAAVIAMIARRVQRDQGPFQQAKSQELHTLANKCKYWAESLKLRDEVQPPPETSQRYKLGALHG